VEGHKHLTARLWSHERATGKNGKYQIGGGNTTFFGIWSARLWALPLCSFLTNFPILRFSV
jgi:hypothetical protein